MEKYPQFLEHEKIADYSFPTNITQAFGIFLEPENNPDKPSNLENTIM